ncbi:MAG: hypothetical protein HDR88_09390 [Bacteroides sp.]|nr:hypothetical protein [Bacteroides sp.]
MDENKGNNLEEQTRVVKIVLWGEGVRIDVFDDAEDIIDCYNALRADVDLFEVTVYDGDYRKEIKESDLGKSLGWDNDEDPDFDKCNFDSGCNLWEPEEDGASRIDWVQTKVYGEVEIELPVNENFDPHKVRLINSEFGLPDSEEPVYIGLFYNGKQYDINLDMDTEREISVETIWEE